MVEVIMEALRELVAPAEEALEGLITLSRIAVLLTLVVVAEVLAVPLAGLQERERLAAQA